MNSSKDEQEYNILGTRIKLSDPNEKDNTKAIAAINFILEEIENQKLSKKDVNITDHDIAVLTLLELGNKYLELKDDFHSEMLFIKNEVIAAKNFVSQLDYQVV